MQQKRLKVTHEVGLHARPAALFVKLASQFESDIQVRNATQDGEWVDAKSILGILTLGVEQNHEIEMIVDGMDEERAAKMLKELVDSNFSEID